MERWGRCSTSDGRWARWSQPSQADLQQIAVVNPDASTFTLIGANHLIHDTKGQRERFWTIVRDFLGSIND